MRAKIAGMLCGALVIAGCSGCRESRAPDCLSLDTDPVFGLAYVTRYPDGAMRRWKVYRRGADFALEDESTHTGEVYRSRGYGEATRERWYLEQGRSIQHEASEVRESGGLEELAFLRRLVEEDPSTKHDPTIGETWRCNQVRRTEHQVDGQRVTTWRSMRTGLVVRERTHVGGGAGEELVLERVLGREAAEGFFARGKAMDRVNVGSFGDFEDDPFVKSLLEN